ncbi:MAG: tetratricopeptide repeat protein, partial [Cyanobacteria bacterium]|nr:tetratricopeptide repeat protein [Cyanobacteriota bacterium]
TRMSSMDPPWKRALMPVLCASIALPCLVLGGLYLPDMYKNMTVNHALSTGEKEFALGPEHWPMAQAQLEQALKTTDAKALDQKARIEARLARISLYQFDVEAAKTKFLSAAKRLRPKMNENREYYFDCILGLGEVYTFKKDHARGDDYLRRARKLAEEWFGKSPQKADAYFASAKSELKKNPKQALEYYDVALEIYLASGTKSVEKLVAAWVDSAEICMDLKSIDNAATRAEKALKLAAELKDKDTRDEVERRANPIIDAGNVAWQRSQANKSSAEASAAVPSVPTSATPLSQPPALTQTPTQTAAATSPAQPQPTIPAAPFMPPDVIKAMREQQRDLPMVIKQLDNLRKYGGASSQEAMARQQFQSVSGPGLNQISMPAQYHAPTAASQFSGSGLSSIKTYR